MLKPNAARIPNVPSNTTGTVIVVMTVARKFLQEQEHHQEHQHDRFDQGFNHTLDRLGHHRSGVIREHHFHPFREEGLEGVNGITQGFLRCRGRWHRWPVSPPDRRPGRR